MSEVALWMDRFTKVPGGCETARGGERVVRVLRVVHLGRSTSHAISRRGDKSTAKWQGGERERRFFFFVTLTPGAE